MKKLISIILLLILLAGCGKQNVVPTEPAFLSITAEEAKKIMDTAENFVILDVRTLSEYYECRIPGAILVPESEIEEQAENAFPDKNQMILIYGGAGNFKAAHKLQSLGYRCIRAFGDISDWPYETEAGK